MSSEYSISVDWSTEREQYINHGAKAIYLKETEKLEKCKHGNKESDSCSECNCYPRDSERDEEPMMNYVYPLSNEPDEEAILKVSEETSCTIVEKKYKDDDFGEGNGDYFLALCGGGMDLSQSIGLAYIYAQGWIPDSLAFEISKQEGLNLSGLEYRKVMRECSERMKLTSNSYKRAEKEFKQAIRDSLKKEKENKEK